MCHLARTDRCVGRYYQAAERRIYAWTQGVITSAGYYDWLPELFLEKRTILPDGTTILGVHAPPGRDDGSGFGPAATEMELQQLFWNADVDVVFVDHTQALIVTELGAVQLYNLGCVSNHITNDTRSSYLLLTADTTGDSVERRLVKYDNKAAIAHLHVVNHPATDFISRHLNGEYTIEMNNWR